jgi:uncharacterized protein (TIGR02231 family)
MSEKKPLTLDTKIDRVVVYLDGARIYRTGKIELEKGSNRVQISGLTKNLREDSVRVSGKGKGSLGAIDVEAIYHEEVAHEALNKLLIEEDALRKDLANLNKKLEFLNIQHNRLNNVSEKFSVEFPQWFASGEAKLTTLSEFTEYEAKRNASYLKDSQKLADQIEALNKKLATLQAKINEYRNRTQVEQTFQITVSLDAAQKGPFVFELSYQTVGVSWEPSYDVDLQPDKAILKGMANVVNRTLEDWKNVSLEISTAVFKPIRIIYPNPFYIDIYDPYSAPRRSRSGGAKMKKMAMAPSSVAADALYEEREEAKEYAPEEPMYEPEAELKESASGVQSFEIPGKWTIPADGNSHPVTLTKHELKTDKEFYWSAVDSLGVIAQDKITNGDAVILAGNAKVYSDGEFIGETYIDRVAPREEFRLGAREELKITAKKKLLERVKVKAGLAKGKRAISYSYELKLHNYRKKDSKITIKDVIPYSRSERIKIKGFEATPPSTEDNLGIHSWELTMKPDEELIVAYKFGVEWEKDYQITPPLP